MKVTILKAADTFHLVSITLCRILLSVMLMASRLYRDSKSQDHFIDQLKKKRILTCKLITWVYYKRECITTQRKKK